MSKLALIPVLVLLFGLFSCEKETTPLVIPTTYDAAEFESNTVNEYQLRTNFTNYINEVKKGRVAGTVVTEANLRALFTAGGNNSVSNVASSNVRDAHLAMFPLIEKATKSSTYQFGKTPVENPNGGANSGYLFDKTGLEFEQILDKGAFGAIFYKKGAELLTNPTAANLDQALALYGANPTFPNTPTAAKTDQADIWMANYGARRTKASGGLYTQVRDAFIKAQAAIKAGSEYTTERDAATAEILLKWEQINAATVINYLYDVETKLASTNPNDNVLASAMHAYGECVGFLGGFSQISKKKITDAQIDDALTKMNATASYKLIGSPTEIAKLVQVRRDLQVIYGFTDSEMEEFKNNYISLEGR